MAKYYNNRKWDDEDRLPNRAGLKLFETFLFTGLFYLGFNLVFNYLILAIRSINDKNALKFSLDYLRKPPGSLSPFMVLLISLMFAMFLVLRLDTQWRIKNENKNIKGRQRWMTDEELENTFYSFPAEHPEKAQKSGIIVALQDGKYYVDCETIHNLVIGTTRSGKGQTFVMPMIRHICSSQAKHSMVINDPKGEMLENCYEMLKQNGYKIRVLNLRDTNQSSLWNPLQTIIDDYKEYLNETDPMKKDLSKTIKHVQSLATMFTHNDKSDPIWPDSAKSLLVAMILYMLEKAARDGNLSKVSMYSIYSFFVEFGQENEAREGVMCNALDDLFQNLPRGSAAKNAYATSRFSQGETRGSIFTTLSSNIEIFGSDAGISRLTSGNQIDFRDLVNPDEPMALFMVLPDEDKSRNIIAALFTNQCYNYLVEYSANFLGQKLPQRVHFILDEFGNMTPIPDMDTKITVGAGRNLLFSLFVQDLNQLDRNYSEAAKTIRSNCGNLIYINSTDDDTNEYYSRVLGHKTVEYMTYSGDLKSFLNHQSSVVDSQPLISAAELGELQMGDAVTKRQRCFPVRTHFRLFYTFGITPRPIPEINKDMDLIFMPLEETIYPIDTIWEEIFIPETNRQGYCFKQERRMESSGINTAEREVIHWFYKRSEEEDWIPCADEQIKEAVNYISKDGNSRTHWDKKRLEIQKNKKNSLSSDSSSSISTNFAQRAAIDKSVKEIALEHIAGFKMGKNQVGYAELLKNKEYEKAIKLVQKAYKKKYITAPEKNILIHDIDGYNNYQLKET